MSEDRSRSRRRLILLADRRPGNPRVLRSGRNENVCGTEDAPGSVNGTPEATEIVMTIPVLMA